MYTNKQKYKELTHSEYVPIFYNPWYLDVVCDGSWDVVLSEDSGRITGAYVYMIKQKLGLSYIIHPPFCPYMGPLFFDTTLDTQKIYIDLLSQLPSHSLRFMAYHPDTAAHISKLNPGKTKITYLIDQSASKTDRFSLLSSDRRRKIRNARGTFLYQIEEDIRVFIDFLDDSFRSRALQNPYANVNFEAIDNAVDSQKCRKIIKCTDQNGKIMAMGYYLQDAQCVYNMATGVDISYPHEAMSLMLWNELSEAISSGRSFDFEGSAIPGVASLYKSFQGKKRTVPTVYFSANRIIDKLVKLKIPELRQR